MSLLAAYTFNEQRLTPFDYSGNKITAASNNISFIAGQNYGYAAVFTGPGSNCNVNFTPSSFATCTAFTAFVSFYVTSLPSSRSTLINNGGATTNLRLEVMSTGKIGVTFNGTPVDILTTLTVSVGWNTAAIVWDGSLLYAYVNGVLDSSVSKSTSSLSNTTVYIGANNGTETVHVFYGYVDCVEFRSTALSAGDIASLHASPGGVLISETPHNFALGDLIADPTITNLGVVTWVVDVDDFYFYPTSQIGTQYSKIGNIYNSLRQSYNEDNPDYDGNGNGQRSVKYPVAGFADYTNPTRQTTLDYRGLVRNGRTTVFTWFSETQARFNQDATLTTVSNNPLLIGDLQSDGAYIDFKYLMYTANNFNTKTAYVKFGPSGAEQLITTQTLAARNKYFIIEGTIKMLNYHTGAASYKVSYFNTGNNSYTFAYGTLTLNFNQQNQLILQLQGSVTDDITYLEGEGHINSIPGF